ncbi:MAG TPA: alpha-glucan family phosphorylase [Candidatus Paceibacterota bacterium]|nr:alpha-glucan family phosphorylase [Candidatus Paceibacterota bacterium]
MNYAQELQWFRDFRATPQYARLKQRPVAYFCAEFALHDTVPTYSGGLGVLAGDVVREAADRGVPMVAVGLYYNQGYICDWHEDGGKFVEVCREIPPESVGLVPVTNESGERVIVEVPIKDRKVFAQAWRYDVRPSGGAEDGAVVPVFMLDTNLPANSESDRAITNRLYVSDKETRLMQEIVLGIGGLRFVERMGFHPSVYHLNEGHSAFLTLELIRHQMHERSLGFDQAKQFARRRVVFTNHTLVPAGNEVYDNDLVSLVLSGYCQELGVPVQEMLTLGLVHQSSTFSMTMLSMRMSGIVNGVSKLHAEKAREVWTSHPMVGITNGVHIPTWDAFPVADFSGQGAFRAAHQDRKKALLDSLRQWGRQWGPDELLLGWARRITQYKRPMSMVEDTERFADIARRADRPVRLVIAGRPHPNDAEGQKTLTRLRELTEGPLKDVAVYVPEYSIAEAQLLVSGCDVWLNTPVVGFEASGTSGMKAALNGVLPFSTRDGWVAEVELYGIGWPADSERIGTDLLDVLERDIIPLYGAPGISDGWEQNMRNARQMVLDRFSATRMVREYCELLYS